MRRPRLCSHPAAGRPSAGSTGWPILMQVSAVALMTGAPSAAYAQCFGSFNAIASAIGTVNTAFLPNSPAFLSPAPNSAPDQQGGGVWTRAVAGTVDTQADTNSRALFTITPPNGLSFPLPLNTPCRASVKQNFAGFEVGHDIAVLNTRNSDWHFGVLAGYVGVKAETPQNGGDSQTGNFEAPSAGLYTAFSKGSFSADIQARLYNIQFESLGQRLDARGYSFTGNVGYRFDLPVNWTLEPSVGGIFSRTGVDQLNVANVADTFGVPVSALPGFSATTLAALTSSTVQFHNVESALGRASLMLSTSLPLAGGQIVAHPFVTASLFHEFEGKVTASIAATGTFQTTGVFQFQGSDNLTASSIGTYGQFGGGSAFQLADTGLLGFARFDYRTGDNIQGYSVSAGLRYQFDDTSHVAENRARHPEMATKAHPAAGYDWTGPYAGVSAGSTWGGQHWDTNAEPDFAGVLAGGQAGYNYQTGKFVWGIEGDAGLSNARGAKACPNQPLLFSCQDDVGALGSLTGRFGYTWGRALFYTKGGWAFGEVTAGTSLNFINIPVPGAMNVAQSTSWESGWTVGAGMEYALTDRWSAKAEYMHYEFPQSTFTVAQNATANTTTAGNVVRIGVNYHFKP